MPAMPRCTCGHAAAERPGRAAALPGESCSGGCPEHEADREQVRQYRLAADAARRRAGGFAAPGVSACPAGRDLRAGGKLR